MVEIPQGCKQLTDIHVSRASDEKGSGQKGSLAPFPAGRFHACGALLLAAPSLYLGEAESQLHRNSASAHIPVRANFRH